MRLFVTVGTTKFDKLIDGLLSRDVLSYLSASGLTCVTLQTGASALDCSDLSCEGLTVQTYQYKPSLVEDIFSADIVISHAGAGTCIEVLQAGKPLLVIVNDDLMDNHQLELAHRLSDLQYLRYGRVSSLLQSIQTFLSKKDELKPYPKPQQDIFSNFINKLMKV